MNKILILIIMPFISMASTKEEYSESSSKLRKMDTFSLSVYNSLLDPNAADKSLNKKKLTEFLGKAKLCVKDHPAYKKFGFRLIHKHYELKKGEYNIEQSASYRGVDALITSPQTAGEAGFYPASWMLVNNNELNVFEYTSNPNAGRILSLISEDPEPFNHICRLIESYELKALIAPAILLTTLACKDGEKIIESNFIGAKRMSVVTAKKPETDPRIGLIVTSWGPIQHICESEGSCEWRTHCEWNYDEGHHQEGLGSHERVWNHVQHCEDASYCEVWGGMEQVHIHHSDHR